MHNVLDLLQVSVAEGAVTGVVSFLVSGRWVSGFLVTPDEWRAAVHPHVGIMPVGRGYVCLRDASSGAGPDHQSLGWVLLEERQITALGVAPKPVDDPSVLPSLYG
jgi:hypothetical protein